MNDQDLQIAIKEAIEVEQPCWPTAIITYIRNKYDYDVGLITINRQLHGPLSLEVQRYALGWTLKRTQPHTPTPRPDENSMNDQDLQIAIKEAIEVEQPCFAKEITRYISRNFGYVVGYINIHRLLRGSLSHEIEKGDSGWTLKGDATAQLSASLPSDPVYIPAAQLEGEARPNLSHLRSIMRLRSGLPPMDGLEHLSVGYDSAMNEINRLFQEKQRWIMALGDYGEGKTHFLQVLRSISHARGFATCFLSSDSRMSALNHPQRFLPTLLQTLEVPAKIPGNSIHGYENLIFSFAMIDNGYQKIREAVNRSSIDLNNLFKNIYFNLGVLERSQKSGVRSNYVMQTNSLQLLMDDLTGTTISRRGCNRSTRENAYRLLLIAKDLVMSMGCRGLVILIDEAEGIFTKLPNILSRTGAVRVLSSLCHSSRMNNILTAVAMTPDGLQNLQKENHRYYDYNWVDDFESLKAFCSTINSGNYLHVDCGQINSSRDDAQKLLYKTRSLYLKTYLPGTVTTVSAEWLRFVDDNRSSGLPTRLIIRKTIDLLDAIRFRETC